MRKHCGNCANYRKETNQFSEECGKCVSARLENGEMTDPSHWREKPQTNADRIREMSDEELAKFIPDWSYTGACKCDEQPYVDCNNECDKCVLEWLKQPADMRGEEDG